MAWNSLQVCFLLLFCFMLSNTLTCFKLLITFELSSPCSHFIFWLNFYLSLSSLFTVISWFSVIFIIFIPFELPFSTQLFYHSVLFLCCQIHKINGKLKVLNQLYNLLSSTYWWKPLQATFFFLFPLIFKLKPLKSGFDSVSLMLYFQLWQT